MKIDPNDKIHQSVGSPLTKSKVDPQGPAFADILKETAASKPSTTISRPPTLTPVMHPLNIESANETFKSTERVLDLLENYQQQLSDPKADLRSINPTVEQMKKQVETMAPMVSRLAPDNPIKQIAQEALLTLTKEVERYDSGVYVD